MPAGQHRLLTLLGVMAAHMLPLDCTDSLATAAMAAACDPVMTNQHGFMSASESVYAVHYVTIPRRRVLRPDVAGLRGAAAVLCAAVPAVLLGVARPAWLCCAVLCCVRRQPQLGPRASQAGGAAAGLSGPAWATGPTARTSASGAPLHLHLTCIAPGHARVQLLLALLLMHCGSSLPTPSLPTWRTAQAAQAAASVPRRSAGPPAGNKDHQAVQRAWNPASSVGHWWLGCSDVTADVAAQFWQHVITGVCAEVRSSWPGPVQIR